MKPQLDRKRNVHFCEFIKGLKKILFTDKCEKNFEEKLALKFFLKTIHSLGWRFLQRLPPRAFPH